MSEKDPMRPDLGMIDPLGFALGTSSKKGTALAKTTNYAATPKEIATRDGKVLASKDEFGTWHLNIAPEPELIIDPDGYSPMETEELNAKSVWGLE